MQIKTNIVPYKNSSFWKPLIDFATHLGLPIDSIGSNLVAFSRRIGGRVPSYYEVYERPSTFDPLTYDQTENLIVVGELVGLLEPRKKFKPSLPLARRLAPKCTVIRCIKLNDSGEKFFLYGKLVVEENILEWSSGLRIVTNTLGEALGWGVGRIVKKGSRSTRVVEPIWDLGWYLRRGG